MAMKKASSKNERSIQQVNDDTVIYKVLIALGICCVLILGLHLMNRYYVMPDYFTPIQTLAVWIFRAAGVLALADLIGWLAARKKSAFFRRAGAPVFFILLLAACSGLISYHYWVDMASLQYFTFIAATVLYLVYLLYQREFFMISLLTTLSGAVFYLLSRLYSAGGVSSTGIIVSAVLAVVLVAVGLVARAAGKHGGCLKLGGKERRLFMPGFSPLFLLVTCVSWLVCLVAAALLGSVFAYYCMFAAAAYELIAACYYTVKLS